MESREQPRERALTGLLIIFFLALVWAGAIVMWYWPSRKPVENFNSNGLNVSDVPSPEAQIRRAAEKHGPLANDPPAESPSDQDLQR